MDGAGRRNGSRKTPVGESESNGKKPVGEQCRRREEKELWNFGFQNLIHRM